MKNRAETAPEIIRALSTEALIRLRRIGRCNDPGYAYGRELQKAGLVDEVGFKLTERGREVFRYDADNRPGFGKGI